MPITSVRRLISPLSRSRGVGAAVDFRPVVLREAHKGENTGFSLVHQGGKLGDLGSELISHLAPLGRGHVGILLGKGSGDEGCNDAPALLSGMRQDITHEV